MAARPCFPRLGNVRLDHSFGLPGRGILPGARYPSGRVGGLPLFPFLLTDARPNVGSAKRNFFRLWVWDRGFPSSRIPPACSQEEPLGPDPTRWPTLLRPDPIPCTRTSFGPLPQVSGWGKCIRTSYSLESGHGRWASAGCRRAVPGRYGAATLRWESTRGPSGWMPLRDRKMRIH